MNAEAYKMFSVEGKVVIITGGTGFLGMQFAKALGLAGAKVVIWDNSDLSVLGTACIRLAENNIKYFVDQVDITDDKKVIRALNKTLQIFERVDVLINNAAMNPEAGSPEADKQFVPYEEYDIGLARKEIEVNLLGPLICTEAVAPIMMERHQGSIINIASEFANIAPDNRIYKEEGKKDKFKSPVYVATKTGILGFTRACASYLGEYNIRVNALSPGGMPKPEVSKEFCEKLASLNMFRRIPRIGEYNGAILFLCSDASSFMTGQQLIVDGGRTVL